MSTGESEKMSDDLNKQLEEARERVARLEELAKLERRERELRDELGMGEHYHWYPIYIERSNPNIWPNSPYWQDPIYSSDSTEVVCAPQIRYLGLCSRTAE